MSNIAFNNPFIFSLDVIEFDEKLSAIYLHNKISVEFSSKAIHFEENIWVLSSIFDLFTDGLMDMTNRAIVTLQDLDGKSKISVSWSQGTYSLRWETARESLSGIKILTNMKTPLSHDEFFVIRQSFLDFPKWW